MGEAAKRAYSLQPSMISCPQCSTQYPSGTPKCLKDGTALPANISVHNVLERRTPGGTANPWADDLTTDSTRRRDSLQGMMLGEYEALEQLGEGGMGIVYRGIQPMIGKSVAIKVLRPEFADDPRQVQRLLDEARAVNSIGHPGIVDIFAFNKLPDGRQYFVMELLDGHSLEEVLRLSGKLKAYEVIPILEQAMAALDAAHGAGVIHRDLKPSNLFLVDLPDDTRVLKLLDFGLAKSASAPNGSTPQTSTNLVVGTPAYMAPEQARGHEVSPRTDLYAMGVVAYELLTGKVPFEGRLGGRDDDDAARPAAHAAGVSSRRRYPPHSSRWCCGCSPSCRPNRPGSAAEVRRELGRIKKRAHRRADRDRAVDRRAAGAQAAGHRRRHHPAQGRAAARTTAADGVAAAAAQVGSAAGGAAVAPTRRHVVGADTGDSARTRKLEHRPQPGGDHRAQPARRAARPGRRTCAHHPSRHPAPPQLAAAGGMHRGAAVVRRDVRGVLAAFRQPGRGRAGAAPAADAARADRAGRYRGD